MRSIVYSGLACMDKEFDFEFCSWTPCKARVEYAVMTNLTEYTVSSSIIIIGSSDIATIYTHTHTLTHTIALCVCVCAPYNTEQSL